MIFTVEKQIVWSIQIIDQVQTERQVLKIPSFLPWWCDSAKKGNEPPKKSESQGYKRTTKGMIQKFVKDCTQFSSEQMNTEPKSWQVNSSTRLEKEIHNILTVLLYVLQYWHEKGIA